MDHHQAVVKDVPAIEWSSRRSFAWPPSVVVKRAEVTDEAFEFEPP
jgi:hypothetical protein